MSKLDSRLLTNKNFSIISDDCWGGEVYKSLGLQYQTPFIGLFVVNFVELIKDLPSIVNSNLNFVTESNYTDLNQWRQQNGLTYPIASFQRNIEIHFQHYKNEVEAIAKWQRRCERINWSNLIYKFDTKKDNNPINRQRFLQLNEKKIAIHSGKHLNKNYTHYNKKNNTLYVEDWTYDGYEVFHRSLKSFDIINWLNAL